MILTLHRYIFRELLRIFGLATVALTLILSLGSILSPIQKYGVGPQQVVRLLIYTMPVTLTFVLPMAALFAATLAYGRLAGDNEVDACKASGVSPLTLVYPGFVLAVLVAMANLALSFHVMPRYIHKAELAIKADAKQILFRNLQRKGYYSLPDQRFRVYADFANPQKNHLAGVVVVQAGKESQGEIIVAEDAQVSFESTDLSMEVRIAAYNVKQIGSGAGLWVESPGFSATHQFDTLLSDEIKFKNIQELKRIQANPLSFRPIENQARSTLKRLALELLLQDINDVLTLGGTDYPLLGDPNAVRLTAGRINAGANGLNLVDDVEVTEYHSVNGQTLRRFTCARGTLFLNTNTTPATLDLHLENAKASDSVSIFMRYSIRNLILPKKIQQPILGGGTLAQVTSPTLFASLRHGPSPDLASDHQRLSEKIHSTLAEIQSEIHLRLVFGLGCIPMILIGIGLGVIKRDGHLLSAFAASCLPALILVVGIVSGKQVHENSGVQGISGVAMMWVGLAILCFICIHVYRKLLRN